MLKDLLIACFPKFFILSLSFSRNCGWETKLLCKPQESNQNIYITWFDWWKWEIIENLSLPQLDNQERVGGEDVSSVRQRYCSSRLGEVKEHERKSHTTAGGGSSHSCCYGHTSTGPSAGGCGRLKTLLLHQLSRLTALVPWWNTHVKAVILGNAAHL